MLSRLSDPEPLPVHLFKPRPVKPIQGQNVCENTQQQQQSQCFIEMRDQDKNVYPRVGIVTRLLSQLSTGRKPPTVLNVNSPRENHSLENAPAYNRRGVHITRFV